MNNWTGRRRWDSVLDSGSISSSSSLPFPFGENKFQCWIKLDSVNHCIPIDEIQSLNLSLRLNPQSSTLFIVNNVHWKIISSKMLCTLYLKLDNYHYLVICLLKYNCLDNVANVSIKHYMINSLLLSFISYCNGGKNMLRLASFKKTFNYQGNTKLSNNQLHMVKIVD